MTCKWMKVNVVVGVVLIHKFGYVLSVNSTVDLILAKCKNIISFIIVPPRLECLLLLLFDRAYKNSFIAAA